MEEQVQENWCFPEDISLYVDLQSPILKYLLEIERKYWSSDINCSYKFPKAHSTSDSEESNELSIQSLENVTKYKLDKQNIKYYEKEVNNAFTGIKLKDFKKSFSYQKLSSKNRNSNNK